MLAMVSLLFSSTVLGQNDSAFIINKGTNFFVDSGTTVTIKNGKFIQDDTLSIEKFNLAGELQADSGIISRNYNKNRMFLIPAVGNNYGKVLIKAGSISGTGNAPRFGNLHLNSTDSLKLNTNVDVINQLVLENGILNLNAKQLNLFYEENSASIYQAELTGEDETKFIGDAKGLGQVSVRYHNPFNQKASTGGVIPNTTFGGVGATVGASSYTTDINVSRVYDTSQAPNNNFENYFLINPGANISDPEITINYFNRQKPAGSNPTKYKVFRAPTDANANYRPSISVVNQGAKTVFTDKALVTNVAQRYLIGDCPVEPILTLQNNYSICENDTPFVINAYHASHTSSYTYQWYKNGTPDVTNGKDSTYSINVTDNYAMLVTDTSTGCFNYFQFDVYVNPSPKNINFTAQTIKCEDRDIVFTNTTGALSSGAYKNSKWDYNVANLGTSTSTDSGKANGKFIYADSGSFQVMLIMETDSGCKDTSAQTIGVHKNPSSVIAASTFERCANETFVFQNNSTLGGPDQILTSFWSINGIDVQTKNNPNQLQDAQYNRIAPPGPTNRSETLMLITLSNANCRDTATQTIQVRPVPSAVPAIVINPTRNPIKFCIDTTISLQANSVQNTVSFNWDFGNSATNTANNAKRTQQNPNSILFSEAGTYIPKVHVTSNLGCKDSFPTASIVVHPLPTPTFAIQEDTVCYGTDINLTNTKQANTTYNWTFGDATTSNSQNATLAKTYNSDGVFTIKLDAESQFGCKNDSSKIVRIKPMPAVSFTTSDKCEDSTVTFSTTVNSTPAGAAALNAPTYHWDFDNTNANALNTAQRSVLNPSITYPQHSGAGNYSPNIFVVAEKCTSSTATNTITIFPNPRAAFTGGNNCNGGDIGFTNTSTIDNPGTNSYNWDMGDGNTSLTHAGSFNYTYANQSSSNYTVVLKATSNQGCIHDTSVLVRNYALPTASFKDSLANQCLDSTSTFINLSTMTDGSTMLYDWRYNDGDSSTLKDPTHIYQNDGLYNVKLTVRPSDLTNPCRSDTTIAITIYPLPQTNFSFTDNCADDSIRFTNNTTISSGTITYKWNFNGQTPDTTITANSFKYAYTTAATRQVILEASSDKGCPISDTQDVRFYGYVKTQFDTNNASVCIFDTSKFTNTSIEKGNDPWLYHWTFGNGDTSALENPNEYYSPTTPGFGIDQPYTVKLVVKSSDTSNVCTDSIQKVIYIHPLPDSSFNITLDTFCLGIKTSFIKNTAQNLYTYHWDFGDANNDSSTTFTQHTYTNHGSFTPKMTAISEYNCVSDDTQNVFVLQVPQPNFTIQKDTVCATDTIVLIDSSDNVANQYVWNFGDGTPNDSNRSRLDTIRRVYPGANIYQVSLTGIKGECFKTIRKSVVIEPDPVVQFTLNRDANNGSKVDIANTSYLPNGSNGTLSFDWSFGDGNTDTTKLNFFSHLYANTGRYGVKLVATSSFGCVDEKIDSITTVGSPTSDFALSQTTVCKGDSFTFTNNSANAQTYFWNFGDGSTSTSATPKHNYTQSGKYLVQLIAKDTNNYSDTSSQLVTINAIPIVQFTNNSNICAGSQVVLNNTSFVQSSDTLAYKWFFGDNDTSVNQNTIHRYDTGSTYQILLEVTSSAGCVDSLTKSVNVYSGPIAQFDSAGARACAGSLSALTNQTTIKTGETISGYLWRLQGVPNQPTTQNTSITYGSAGQYAVELVATSTRGCKDSITQLITIDSVPTLNFGGTQNTCGTSLTLDAQNPGSTYSWNTSASTKTITVNTSGTYAVTVTSPGAQSCQTIDTVVVNLNTQVDPNLGNNFSACGDTTLDANNPGSTYNWAWTSGSSTSRTINVTASGTYRVTVTDQNGCVGLDTVTATITAPPVVSLGANINVCAGTPVTLDAGNTGFNFNWSNNATTQTINNPATGVYVVAVTDPSTLCVSNDTINVQYQNAPTFTLGSDRSVCGTQSVLLNAGAFANGTYLWSDNSSLQTLAVNQTGTYWAKITDNSNSCSTTDTVQVTVNANPTPSLANVSGCAGTNLTLSPLSGSNAGYTFSWSDNSTDSTLVPTSTGLYSVTVTNATTACFASASSNVSINTTPTVNLGNDTNLCGGSSLLLSVGSTSYSAAWSTGSNSPAISVSNAGSYYVSATQNSCTDTDTIVITSTAKPMVNLGTQSSICSNDTLQLDAGNAGSNYLWSDASTNQVLNVTSSGFYSVTVTDANGCTGNANLNVQSFTAPTVDLGGNDTICQGQSVILNAQNPGATYSWNTTATTQAIQASAANSFIVTVTDQNNCTDSDTMAIVHTTPPVVNLGGNKAICSGAVDTLNAGNPGLSYNWSTGDTTQKILVSTGGTFRVTVTNGSCSAQDQMVVSVNAVPNVNLGVDKVGCVGDSITLAPLNNYAAGTTYNWSTTGNTRTIKTGTAGNFALSVTNANNCSGTDTVSVSILAVPVVNLPSTITACGDTILDAGNAGATFSWNTNATTQTVSANQSGTYIVDVSVSNCSSKDTAVVTINALPVVNLGSDISACANNAPTFNAGLIGKKYLWKSGDTTQTYTPSTSDTLWVMVTDNKGCAGSDTVIANFNAGPALSLGNDLDSCHYQDLTLDAQNAGNRFLWSTGSRTQTISVNTTGAYSVTVTDAQNCSSDDAINVTLNSIPTVNLGQDRSVCDSTTLLAGNTGSTYLWNDNSTNENLLVQNAGTYWVEVTNAKSCVSKDTVVMTILPTPTLDLGADTSLCSGNTLTLNANNGSNTVLWSNNASTQTITIGNLGTYWAKVTNSLGCSKTDTVNVSIGASPIVELGNDTGFCINQELPLDAQNAGSTYIWGGDNNFSDTSKIATVSAAGKYYVQVTTAGGCIGSDTINFTPKTDTVYAYFLSTSKVEIGDTVQFVDLSYPNITSWNYDFGDLNTSTLQDPEHRYLVDGKYNVSLTVSNGSCQDTRTKEIEVSKRLKFISTDDPNRHVDYLEPTQFIKSNLYPNPSKGSFRLLLELNQVDNIGIYFFDMRGTVLHQEIIEGVDAYVNDFHFDNLAPGMYFMQTNLGRERKIFRVVITR